MERCQRELDDPGEVTVPPSTPSCEDVMGAVLRSFTKDVDGRKMCMNVYDIRLSDTWPSCGMSWPPDLAQVTPWLRVSWHSHCVRRVLTVILQRVENIRGQRLARKS
jgi:carboxypeptidase D